MDKRTLKKRIRQAYEAGGMAAAIDVFSAPDNLRLGEFDYCPSCECETPSIDRECLICGQKTSNTYAVSVNVSMVNWKLLRRQKLALLRAIEDKDTSEDKKDRDLLEGLLSLLDDIQDQTAEAIGEKAVFGKLTTKTKKLTAKDKKLLRKIIDHPEEIYPMEDWRYDVANGDTKLGYKDWVDHNVESHKEDPDEQAR